MPGELTRAGLRRALVVNALTRPVNLAVPAAGLALAAALGAWWPAGLAMLAYLALAAATFLSEEQARQVGERLYGQRRLKSPARRVDPARLAAPIAAPLSAALDEEARIRQAMDRARLPLDELSAEVSRLLEAMGRTAQRAQLVHDYLATHPPERVRERIAQLGGSAAAPDPAVQRTIAALSEQLETQAEMTRLLDRFHAEVEQTAVSLSTIHARVVQMRVASADAVEHELAVQVRDLRQQVDTLCAGIEEAYSSGEPPAA